MQTTVGRPTDTRLPQRWGSSTIPRVSAAGIKRRLHATTHTLYVLDEFTHPMAGGWVDVDEVVQTLTDRPGHQHVVITGRRCPDGVLEAADLVTEMTTVKPPFDAGQKGQ